MSETKRQELVKAYDRHLKAKAHVASFADQSPFGRCNIAEYHASVEAAHEAWVALVSEFGFPEVDFSVYFHVKHIHNDWSCKGIKHHSLNRSREYVTIEATGMTTEQLIETYRANVCTHCFPSAPVAQFRSEAAAAKKQEREQKASTKAAEQAAKAITMPDGSPLRDVLGMKIGSLRSAQIDLVDALLTVEFAEKVYPMGNRAFFAQYEAFVQRAAEAIVAKTGAESKTVVLAEARAKAEKKFKKEYK